MTLAQLNACDRLRFVAELGWIFEHSPWVAERAWEWRPFGTAAELHETMQAVVMRATPDEQLALLRAHPDLGTKISMSDASVREQSGAGLTQLDDRTKARLQSLNQDYRARFGFPFLYAVKGASAPAILTALESRTGHTPDQELREALAQVFRIAGFRLDDALDEER